MRNLNVWVYDRSCTISDMTTCAKYSVDSDYITSSKSKFTLDQDIAWEEGGFLLAKFKDSGTVAYFGVTDSMEDDELVCNKLISLVNFQFAATRVSGASFETHGRNLLNKYLIEDTSKKMSALQLEVVTNTSHLYQPKEQVTPTNLMTYFVNAFKKYNIVWGFNGIVNGALKTTLEKKTKTLQIKDNSSDFVNWKVSTTSVGKGVENELMIVNKNTSNSEGPNILATYYLTTDNELTTDINHPKVNRPTITKVYIYDTTAVDKPAYQDVADSELKGNYYAHEISFGLYLDSQLISFEDLTEGTLVNISHKGVTYRSVLTGISFSNTADYVTLKFGHIRSRLSELLN